jgi:hypothetical protein
MTFDEQALTRDLDSRVGRLLAYDPAHAGRIDVLTVRNDRSGVPGTMIDKVAAARRAQPELRNPTPISRGFVWRRS